VSARNRISIPAIATKINRIATYLDDSLSANHPEAKLAIALMPNVNPKAEAATVADTFISVINETSWVVTTLYPIAMKAKLIHINHKAGLLRKESSPVFSATLVDSVVV
jgi:hypothetical protein